MAIRMAQGWLASSPTPMPPAGHLWMHGDTLRAFHLAERCVYLRHSLLIYIQCHLIIDREPLTSASSVAAGHLPPSVSLCPSSLGQKDSSVSGPSSTWRFSRLREGSSCCWRLCTLSPRCHTVVDEDTKGGHPRRKKWTCSSALTCHRSPRACGHKGAPKSISNNMLEASECPAVI